MKKELVTISAMLLAYFMNQPCYAQTDEEIRKSIQSILNVRHPQDNRQTWQALGASAPQVIISMYRSSRSTYEKIRLIDGLAWFDDAEAVKFLKEESKSNTNQVIQNAAIRSIALSQGMKEREFLANSLASQSPLVRVETAKTLTRLQNDEADQMVKNYLGKERNSEVLSKVNQYRARHQKESVIKKKNPHPI